MTGKEHEKNDVERLQEALREQERRDRRDRLAREAYNRWTESHGES